MTDGELSGGPEPEAGLSREELWDERTRPRAPAADPHRHYAPQDLLAGRRLIEVHNYLRAEVAELRELMADLIAGSAEHESARARLHTMVLRPGNRSLHGYCEAFCRLVVMHHMREDIDVFPRLRTSQPRVGPVLDRLEEEHLILHGVIERIDRALATPPLDLPRLRATVDLFTDALLSHLTYEENELTESLARLWG